MKEINVKKIKKIDEETLKKLEEEHKKWMDFRMKSKKITELERYRMLARKIQKFDNPDNLSLMQIQHKIAKENGYKCWPDLYIKLKEKEKSENLCN